MLTLRSPPHSIPWLYLTPVLYSMPYFPAHFTSLSRKNRRALQPVIAILSSDQVGSLFPFLLRKYIHCDASLLSSMLHVASPLLHLFTPALHPIPLDAFLFSMCSFLISIPQYVLSLSSGPHPTQCVHYCSRCAFLFSIPLDASLFSAPLYV